MKIIWFSYQFPRIMRRYKSFFLPFFLLALFLCECPIWICLLLSTIVVALTKEGKTISSENNNKRGKSFEPETEIEKRKSKRIRQRHKLRNEKENTGKTDFISLSFIVHVGPRIKNRHLWSSCFRWTLSTCRLEGLM